MSLDRRALGRVAEQTARLHLERLGYRVVETNFSCRGGELDLVAWHHQTLCFIEVRSRRDEQLGAPLETIGTTKLRRLVKAARAYLAARHPPRCEMRFDVVGVTGGVVTAVVADAFRLDELY